MAVTERWKTLILLLLVSQISANMTPQHFKYLKYTQEHHPELLLEPEGLPHNVPNHQLFAVYDFIVVGSGPGGASVTNRLTEEPDWTVLLLEAGREEVPISDFPLMAAHFQHTDYNWGYRALPQSNACLGLKDQRCSWPRGKGMGGTSIINYMIYTRGHPRDYDGWRDMGNPGWGWNDVFKYFLKSENAKGNFANSVFHSKGGYLNVESVPYNTPLQKAFLDSGVETGNPLLDDYNSGVLLGFTPLQATIRSGSRCSASKAFLRPIRNRPNMHIAKSAQVTKILINPQTKKAFGVEFQRYGKRWTVRARKEVILSAGSINTPQLLMLSGIGPREHLESHNIPVIQDLPGVGQNLQEHVSMCGLTFLVNDTVGIVEQRILDDLKPISEFVNTGKGILTIPGGVEGLGYIRTKIANTPRDYPDIELIFATGHLGVDDGRVIRTGIGVKDEIYNAAFASTNSKDGWTVWPMLLKPQSRGWVKLKNNNPLSWPLMYGNYFDDEHDLNVVVEGVKYAVELSKTRAFQRYNSTLHTVPLPACKHLLFGSDDYWKCAVRQLTTTLHHQCGTAKMGPGNDPMAVVDHELRVYGVQGLRVVDASIIPRIPAAHTMATSYMIGEKASDMIKKAYWKQPH